MLRDQETVEAGALGAHCMLNECFRLPLLVAAEVGESSHVTVSSGVGSHEG